MERMAIIGMSFLFCGWLCAQGGPSPILKDLLEHGGIATFELTVKDGVVAVPERAAPRGV